MANQDQLPASSATTVDLRSGSDRRSAWRGGRRDEDWLNRPADLRRHVAPRLSPLSQWIAALPLHHLAADRH
jgi:hypothetical protein